MSLVSKLLLYSFCLEREEVLFIDSNQMAADSGFVAFA